MSVPVLYRFIRESRSELGARIVGMLMSFIANDDGICWVSQKRLSEQSCLSERGVRDAIRRLEDLGEVETRQAQRGRVRVNVYRLWCGEVPQYEKLPFTVGDPFSERPADIAGGTSTTGRSRPDDRQIVARTPSYERQGKDNGARARDEVWDELERLFGEVAPKTNAHAKRNKAVADLKRLGASPEAIVLAYAAWSSSFPGTTLTDVALATHYPQLMNSRKPLMPKTPPCAECGVGGGLHAADCSHVGAAA